MQVGNDVSWKETKEGLKTMLWPSLLGGGSRKWVFLRMKMNREDASRVLGGMAEGKGQIPIGRVSEFADVPKAYEQLMTGRVSGKTVVRMPALEDWERGR